MKKSIAILLLLFGAMCAFAQNTPIAATDGVPLTNITEVTAQGDNDFVVIGAKIGTDYFWRKIKGKNLKKGYAPYVAQSPLNYLPSPIGNTMNLNVVFKSTADNHVYYIDPLGTAICFDCIAGSQYTAGAGIGIDVNRIISAKTLYESNGQLTSNRTVDCNNNRLSFTNTGNAGFYAKTGLNSAGQFYAPSSFMIRANNSSGFPNATGFWSTNEFFLQGGSTLATNFAKFSNYDSSRNDDGLPTSVTTFSADGKLERHPLSELVTAIGGTGGGGGGTTAQVQTDWNETNSTLPSFLKNKPPLLQGLPGPVGATGAAGAQGAQGVAGATGATGQGVPMGGAAGQVLSKVDGTNYNTTWVNAPAGGGGTTYTAGLGININGANQISATDNSASNEIQALTFTAPNQLGISGVAGSVSLPMPTAGAGISVNNNEVTNTGDLSPTDLYEFPTAAANAGRYLKANQAGNGVLWGDAPTNYISLAPPRTLGQSALPLNGILLPIPISGSGITVGSPNSNNEYPINNTGDNTASDLYEIPPINANLNGQYLKANNNANPVTLEWATAPGIAYQAGNGIAFGGGNVINNSGDLSNTNEIQNLSLSGTTLNISQGVGVDLAPLKTPSGITVGLNAGNLYTTVSGVTGSLALSNSSNVGKLLGIDNITGSGAFVNAFGATNGSVIKVNNNKFELGTLAGDNWGTQSVAHSPDFIGGGTAAGDILELANSGVTAGIYNWGTVDNKGRVTNASNISVPATGQLLGGLVDWIIPYQSLITTSSGIYAAGNLQPPFGATSMSWYVGFGAAGGAAVSLDLSDNLTSSSGGASGTRAIATGNSIGYTLSLSGIQANTKGLYLSYSFKK
jgi:hypothetical protein